MPKISGDGASAPGLLARREGALPAEKLPVILEVLPNDDYALLDSGGGEKLEQYGPYRIVRPEGQAIWLPSLPQKEWDQADAVFTGNTDEEGIGRWAFPKVPLGETWPMQHDGISFHGRFTSFRHVGVFPEQAAHWSFMDGLIRDGVKSGYDLDLTRAVSDAVQVPVIASGGVGNAQDLVDGVKKGHASAVLAASIFHFGEVSIAQAKAALAAAGLPTRPI